MPLKCLLLIVGFVFALSVFAECPDFATGVDIGTPADPALAEISGVAASRQHPGVLWVHNDSGDTARIFAIRDDGTTLGEYAIEGANAIDWEDIALGPGPVAGVDYLYIGDIGDNDRVRANIQVYRIPEPVVDANQAPVQASVSGAELFTLSYPGAPATVYDCETLMVDPLSGDILLVTKQASGVNDVQVMLLPAPAAPGAYTLTRVNGMTFAPGLGYRVTGGDISPDGKEIVLHQYNGVIYWRVTNEAHLYDVFSQPACSVYAPFDVQGEAIAWKPDGSGFYTLSEQATLGPRPIWFYRREVFLDADQDHDESISLSELLRLVQFYNARGYHCEAGTEDGFAPGAGETNCTPHNTDYAPQDWSIRLTELSRAIQIYNIGEYEYCPGQATEDGFCPEG